jgi:hypothetical protein
MLDRTTFLGLAVAMAAALLLIVLVSSTTGPQASRADVASPSISIEELHAKVDHRELPVHAIPLP